MLFKFALYSFSGGMVYLINMMSVYKYYDKILMAEVWRTAFDNFQLLNESKTDGTPFL